MDTKGFIMGLMGDSTPVLSSQSFSTIADADPVLEMKKNEFEILERQLKSFERNLKLFRSLSKFERILKVFERHLKVG